MARAHREAYDARHAPLGARPRSSSPTSATRARAAAPPTSCATDTTRAGSGGGSAAPAGARSRRWTGTIFEGHRIPASDWCEFAIQLLSFDSLAEVARSNRRSPTTPPYWLAEAVPRPGRRPGRRRPLREGPDRRDVLPGARRRAREVRRRPRQAGLLAQQALRRRGRPTARGAPWSSPAGGASRAAAGRSRRTGPTSSGAPRSSTTGRTRTTGWSGSSPLVSEAHDSRLLSRLPDRENPLPRRQPPPLPPEGLPRPPPRVRQGRPRGLAGPLQRHREPAVGAMAKAAAILDRAMAFPKTLRYREFYEKKRR